jgi:hypothetical protein
LKDLGYQSSKEKCNYGRRLAAESVFSAVKRISLEHVMATKTENLMQEVVLKFAFYNLIVKRRRRTPLQAGGASEAPHETRTR